MLKQIRRKVATSISIIQEGEDFLHNSWLRTPFLNSISIGALSSRILDTPDITYDIEKPFFTEHFFKLGKPVLFPEELKYLFNKVGTNPVFFQLLYVPSKVIYHPDIEPQPAGYSAKQIKFRMPNAANWDIDVKFRLAEPNSFLFIFSQPEIKDYLNNLKTKIERIELLNIEEMFADAADTVIKEINVLNPDTLINEISVGNFGKLKLKKLKIDKIYKSPDLLNIKIPGMGKYKSKVSYLKLRKIKSTKVSKTPILNFVQPSTLSARFNFESKSSIKMYDIEKKKILNDPGLMNDELSTETGVNQAVKLLLKTTHNVDWEKRKEPNIIINKQEEDSSRFLAENDRAFLAEETGLDKIKESLVALKFLIQSKVINTALIVYPSSSLGFDEEEKHLGISQGWLGKLKNYCEELSYSIVTGDDDERLDLWNKSSVVHLVDHDSFVRDYSLNILDKQTLLNFDCIIVDEIHVLLDDSDKSKSVLKEINPNIFWALTNIVGDNILTLLNEFLNNKCKIDEKRLRFIDDTERDFSVIKHEECWLEPDEYQKVEYRETLAECRKEFKRVLESGNPFRYLSNIFILVHKIFQVENFAHGYDTSPKSNLLIQQIKTIEKNLKKVIVCSQYDRQGTKKIEKLLDHNKINYISVPSSLSGEEMKKAISLFKSRKAITVFLTNVRLSQLNFGDYHVPYLIRFDSWWNPASLWQTQNLFDPGDKNNRTINVFTYKMLNTIDEQIKRILFSKKIIDNNILNAMPLNTINDLISVDEWLKVFDMPVEDDSEKTRRLYDETVQKLNNLSIADYRATLSRFFYTIGYTNIEILEHENSASFDMTGEGKSGNQVVYLNCRVLLDEIVTRNTIKQIIFDVLVSDNMNIFIVTRGNFEEGSEKLARNNVILLDINKLTKQLVNLHLVQTEEKQSI